MKKLRSISIALILGVFLISQSGCFGSFGLTKKVYEFNQGVGGKLVNQLVFWGLCAVPVYEVASFLDLFVFNLIEFWTGSNPVALQNGNEQIRYYSRNDKLFRVSTAPNSITVRQVQGPHKGREAKFIYNEARKAWFVQANDRIVELNTLAGN